MRKFRFRWKILASDGKGLAARCRTALFAGGYSLIDSYWVLFYIALFAGGYTLIHSYWLLYYTFCTQVTAMDVVILAGGWRMHAACCPLFVLYCMLFYATVCDTYFVMNSDTRLRCLLPVSIEDPPISSSSRSRAFASGCPLLASVRLDAS